MRTRITSSFYGTNRITYFSHLGNSKVGSITRRCTCFLKQQIILMVYNIRPRRTQILSTLFSALFSVSKAAPSTGRTLSKYLLNTQFDRSNACLSVVGRVIYGCNNL